MRVGAEEGRRICSQSHPRSSRRVLGPPCGQRDRTSAWPVTSPNENALNAATAASAPPCTTHPPRGPLAQASRRARVLNAQRADAGLLKTRAVREGAPAVCTATAPPRGPRSLSLALAAPKQRSARLPYNSGLQLTKSRRLRCITAVLAAAHAPRDRGPENAVLLSPPGLGPSQLKPHPLDRLRTEGPPRPGQGNMERESDRILGAVRVMAVLFVPIACVAWHHAVTGSSWVAWLDPPSPLGSPHDWIGRSAVLVASVLMFAKSRTVLVRAVSSLFGATSLIRPELDGLLDRPAAWPRFFDACAATLLVLLACRVLWLHRASTRNPASRADTEGAV